MAQRKEGHLQAKEELLQSQPKKGRIRDGPDALDETRSDKDADCPSLPKGRKDDALYREELGRWAEGFELG